MNALSKFIILKENHNFLKSIDVLFCDLTF